MDTTVIPGMPSKPRKIGIFCLMMFAVPVGPETSAYVITYKKVQAPVNPNSPRRFEEFHPQRLRSRW